MNPYYPNCNFQPKKPQPNWGVIGVIIFLILFWGAMLRGCAYAELINMNAIRTIESNGNAFAYNRYSHARGLYQITPIVLKEYNKLNKVNHSEGDLFNPLVNEKIAAGIVWPSGSLTVSRLLATRCA